MCVSHQIHHLVLKWVLLVAFSAACDNVEIVQNKLESVPPQWSRTDNIIAEAIARVKDDVPSTNIDEVSLAAPWRGQVNDTSLMNTAAARSNVNVYTAPSHEQYIIDHGMDLVFQLSPSSKTKIPRPQHHARTTWKRDVVRTAPSGFSLVDNFKRCKISLVQEHNGSDGIQELFLEPKSSTSFLHVFKCGGSTTARAVLERGGEVYRGFHGFDQRDFDDARWLRVAFVRDPMPRLLSSFHEVLSRTTQAGEMHPESKEEHIAEFVGMIDKIHADPRKGVQGIPHGAHFVAQTNFLTRPTRRRFTWGSASKRDIDYIGHADNLHDELAHLFQDPDIKLEYATGSTGATVHKDDFRLIESDIPVATQRKICEVYRDDFCCFGFKFPKECDITC